MDDGRSSKLTFWRTLTVLAVVGFLVGLLLPMIVIQHPYPMIPRLPPEERGRVYLPSGLSIVRPPGWEVMTEEKPGASGGSFTFYYPLTHSTALKVAWSREEPKREVAGRAIMFQARPAWLTIERQAPEPSVLRGGDRREANARLNHGFFAATVVASRDDRWITIQFSCLGDYSAVPDMIWKYLETLECPPLASSKPA